MKRFNLDLSFDDLWAIICFLGILAIMNFAPILPNDYWFHQTYGKDIITLGYLSFEDTYTFTMDGANYDSLAVYWLAEVFMQLIRVNTGIWETLFYGLVVSTAYYLTYLTIQIKEKNKFAAGFALIYAILLGATNWNIRPQIFTYLYLAIILWSLAKLESLDTNSKNQNHKFWLWIIVFVSLLLWQNSHGTFLFGYMIIFFWILGNLRGLKIIIVMGILVLLPLLTPMGLSMFEYFLRMFGSTMASRNIIEWQPASIFTITGQIFYPLLVIVLSFGFKKPKLRKAEWIVFFVFLFLSLRYRRAIIFFGFYSAPFLAVELAKLSFFNRERNNNLPHIKLLTWSIALVVTILTMSTLPIFKQYLPIPEIRKDRFSINTPIDAVNALSNYDRSGNVFAHFSYASYITYHSNANFKIFMDTRFEFYSDQVFNDFLLINGASPGWKETALRYQIDYWLLSKEKQPKLIQALESEKTYLILFEDEEFILLTGDY